MLAGPASNTRRHLGAGK